MNGRPHPFQRDLTPNPLSHEERGPRANGRSEGDRSIQAEGWPADKSAPTHLAVTKAADAAWRETLLSLGAILF